VPVLAETIAASLRRRILRDGSGPLPNTDQLVAEFGVSYPSVREAIRILETEGLVTVKRGKGGGLEGHRPDEGFAAYHLGLVLEAEQVTLRDLADGLQLLEPLCAAECARRADRATAVVPVLRANVEATAALTGAGFTATAREFHDLLVGLCPNVTVRSVVRTLVALWSAQEQAWAEERVRTGSYPSATEVAEVVKTHRKLVEAIEAGRPDAAERLARAHLVATQARVLETERIAARKPAR
jgi:DNA-binding FadR family transcriptional regulator